MNANLKSSRRSLLLALGASAVAGPAPAAAPPPGALLQRISWGPTAASMAQLSRQGRRRFLAQQLGDGRGLEPPRAVGDQIAAMRISNEPPEDLFVWSEAQKRAIKDAPSEAKGDLQRTYYAAKDQLLTEARQRMVLRALYSPHQLKEVMVWFWLNHFSVHAAKADIVGLSVADYEERAIRPHALGRFGDLVAATVRHPAMLRYLDNARSRKGAVNENYARELMELHVLGVDAGYTQDDVQALARVLTGLGLMGLAPDTKPMPEALKGDYVRDGLFVFDPRRHDYGAKRLLGRDVPARQSGGLAEVDEALAILLAHPACARFICRKLAVYFVADEPPPVLVAAMSTAFTRSGGDIAQVLAALFDAPQFAAALGGRFKDPTRYVLSAVRLAYGDDAQPTGAPVQDWIRRVGEPVFGRLTPDGYPLTSAAWTGGAQMTARFEVAQEIAIHLEAGDGAADLSARSAGPVLGARARDVVMSAQGLRARNALLLSSPDFMRG